MARSLGAEASSAARIGGDQASVRGDQRERDVLDADVAVLQFECLAGAELKDFLRPRVNGRVPCVAGVGGLILAAASADPADKLGIR